ncbi:Insulinase family protein [Candidatus Hepatincolaceae symbiont of Richtersius coronifer]
MPSLQNMLNIIRNKLFAFLFLLFSSNIIFLNSAQAVAYQALRFSNSLEVYLIKTKSPIATHIITYGVGGVEETSSQEGIAHLLEHMTFLGSNRYSKDKLMRTIKSIGADYNAYVSSDITLYYFNFPVEHLEEIMRIEADRMQWLTLNPDDFKNEKKVVNEERNRSNNSYARELYATLNQHRYSTTNYGRNTLGWVENFNEITLQNLQDFYKKWYRPDNAKIFIIGNIEFKEFERLAKKHYKKLKNMKVDRIRPTYLEQTYKANVVLDYQDPRVKLQQIIISYLVPSLISDNSEKKKNAYSLVILNHLLNTESGALHKSLVLDKKIATYISINYEDDKKGDTSFSFSLIPANNINLDSLLTEAKIEISKILTQGFTKEELAKAIKQIKDDLEYLQEQEENYINKVAVYVNAGMTFEDFMKYDEYISEVTLDNLNLMAKTLVNQKTVTVKVLKE